MAAQSVPNTAENSLKRNQAAGVLQKSHLKWWTDDRKKLDNIKIKKNCNGLYNLGRRWVKTKSNITKKASLNKESSRALHRSVPPIHELTTHNIGYKPNSNVVRYQKCAPAPTNMTYLPSAQEKLLQSRKVLAKIIGFDAGVFKHPIKSEKAEIRHTGSNQMIEDDLLSPRYNNAFSPVRSPRSLKSPREYELSRSEFLKGHGVPATPRLLRGGYSKKYGIRRQISASNQLELSPDFSPESRKSPLHFNTPAGDKSNVETPTDGTKIVSPLNVEERIKQELTYSNNLIIPFSTEGHDESKTALTNGLVSRDRTRDAPWVYCYKVKKDRLKLSQLLTTNNVNDSAIDELLPAF